MPSPALSGASARPQRTALPPRDVGADAEQTKDLDPSLPAHVPAQDNRTLLGHASRPSGHAKAAQSPPLPEHRVARSERQRTLDREGVASARQRSRDRNIAHSRAMDALEAALAGCQRENESLRRRLVQLQRDSDALQSFVQSSRDLAREGDSLERESHVARPPTADPMSAERVD